MFDINGVASCIMCQKPVYYLSTHGHQTMPFTQHRYVIEGL